ncbi:MAG: RNA polymerase sigma factor [Sandaracinaceae bacterium]|nr:RNA polymerase sigma factor [Sandaracinaceae bacterium]
MVRDQVEHAFRTNQRALVGYLTRMVVREDVAEDLAQQALVRALEQKALPDSPSELRAWLFRVGTNLALDHLKKHATWRETVLDEARDRAIASASFVAETRLLAGSPETRTIARDHLSVCFSCTSRNLQPQEAAALLLKEVYDFTNEEVAEVLGATFGQAKAWIQSARAKLEGRYATTCALVTQKGVCHQCVELDSFLAADRGDPLAGTDRDLDARLRVVRERRETPLGPWHRAMMRLVDEVLDARPSEPTH